MGLRHRLTLANSQFSTSPPQITFQAADGLRRKVSKPKYTYDVMIVYGEVRSGEVPAMCINSLAHST